MTDNSAKITLYGPYFSHALTKIRCILTYTNTPFIHQPSQTSNGLFTRNSSWWEQPIVAMAGQTTDQLDYVISKLLLTLDLPENREWEHRVARELDMALRIHCSAIDWYRLARKTFVIRSPIGLAECIFFRRRQVHGTKRRAERMGLSASNTNLAYIARKFKLAMTGVFFHGDRPGHVDLSFYGTIAGFLYANCDIGRFILGSAALDQWYSSMRAELPLERLFPASRPTGF